MAMAEVQLLSSWASPFAMRAKVALALKGIQYENLEQDLRNKSDLLIKYNPVYKKIPVLVHNGKPVCESLIITSYIDDAWPENENRPGFFPKDPHARACIRFWADFIDKKFVDSAFKTMKTQGEEKEKCIQDLVEAAKILDQHLGQSGEKPFFHGSSLGFADIALSPFIVWLPALQEVGGFDFPNETECPNLHRWFSTGREKPTVKETLPEVEKLVEVVYRLQKMWSLSSSK